MAVLTTGRLPERLTPLVGRETEVGEVARALSGCRLLTLTGPGGAGKTRLALAAAARLAEAGEAGDAGADVAWVELASVNDPLVIAPTVAARLGVPEAQGRDPVADIVAHLTGRHPGAGKVLVVIDNCEHLADDIARLTAPLLAECSSLSVLATSREPLGVEGERCWPVPPLGHAYAARLFEDRARMVAPSFSITDGNKQVVDEVCARLDGLPLAIELAAARMRVLSVRQLAERLDDMFGVLIGGARSAPPRHQTLLATLDWSHDLLSGDEQTVFRRLAVFADGFSIAAAEYVAAFGDTRPEQVLDLLARLSDKSLIQVDGERYQMLATIREYAAVQLAQAGERDQAHGRHLRFYTELAEQAGASIERAAAAGLEAELDRLDQEKANLRAATGHARSTGDAVSALRIVGQLDRYAYLRGHYHEVREWMDQAVADGPAAPAGYRARALYGSGRLAHLQCDYEPAVRRLDAALALYRVLGDDAGIAACLQALGSVAREQGRYVRSAQLHAESLELARAARDARAEASARGYLGFVSWLQGDLDLATAECIRALTMFRQLGDPEGTAWALISLGAVARYRGEPDEAATLLRESLDLSRSIGFLEGIAWCEEQLGLVALAGGDLREAQARLRSSYATHRDLGDRWRMASVLEGQAALAVAGGEDASHAERAAWLLGLAQAVREGIGTVLAPCERPQHDQSVAAARSALGEAAYEAARRRGAAASGAEEFEGKLPGPPSAPRPVSPWHISSPLTGATPVLPAPPFTSPLTGASAIMTGAPPPTRPRSRPATPASASGTSSPPPLSQVPPLPRVQPPSAGGSAEGVPPSVSPPGDPAGAVAGSTAESPAPLPVPPMSGGRADVTGGGAAGQGALPVPLPSGRPGLADDGVGARSAAPLGASWRGVQAGPRGSGDGAVRSVTPARSPSPGGQAGTETAGAGAGLDVAMDRPGSAPGDPSDGLGGSRGGMESAGSVRDDGVDSSEPAGGSAPAAARPARAARRPATPAPRPSGPLRVRALGRATVELGGTALTAADWGYAKPRELMFLLITSPPLTREQLRAALWPELPPKQLGNALHTALRELRRALGDPDWIVYAAGQYSVNRARAFDCDVDAFEASLATAGRARPASAGLPDLRRAVAAYGGDFLAGMTVGEWARVRRDELSRRFETALLATGRLQAAAGNHQAAVTAFRRAVEHEPLNESAHRELMTCWAQLGETARAVRHYAELTVLLKDRVGVPPAPETTALYERLAGRTQASD